VGGGFAEVSGDRCTVLAESAVPVADIDRAATQKDIQDISSELPDADEAERAKLEARLRIAEARLAAAG
jgi:F-type H+-transporting ATPase subunit epsilon